ncbi:hypothetical protein CROQUDRAFT_714721 [Cronartium quercuum f. sp. fusiforme G11]|uniref:GH18 domain-containing protein n=1 Tax=Cronartium quercuum f. sp. fusiforme G11 TaxID=708437 RepID=A0A9P6TEW2_9BASI|nr:hypothetical protein CROQUDRAFT_714721 [Cronartium quercuum f. sp. fusiforme G11]
MIGLNFSLFAVVGMLLNFACAADVQATTSRKKLMGYYAAYHSQVQSVAQIPWQLYTDVTFFVAIPQLNHSFGFPPGLNASLFNQLAPDFVKQAKSQNVNPILSVGGYTGSGAFSVMVKDDRSRRDYAKTLVDYAKRYGFVGLDIDWEYPNSLGIGCNNYNKADTVHFGAFVKEIRSIWPTGILSAALSINGLIGANGTATTQETADLVKYLNFTNVMAYDVFGNWALTTGPLAPLFDTCAPENPVSVETALNVFLKQGFHRNQILIGAPGYARSYQLISPQLVPRRVAGHTSYYYQKHTKAAPPGGATDDKPGKDVCGVMNGWAGIWLVKELISNHWLSANEASGENGYRRYFDECSGEPFLTNGTYFFSYDDQFSLRAKANFTKHAHLAGMFIFDTLGQPDLAIQVVKDTLQ